ncbi:hypothetical protein OIU74_004985 [Salix koriyanagi]|uniref:Uncharacterized protein n=1 Tax=Salix koriyanagi TaxID=2511006 RepID=A0A9Q0UN14_9ROSI|nr:hypothetical protein OIU74_004985 [Salix koriyanagi]
MAPIKPTIRPGNFDMKKGMGSLVRPQQRISCDDEVRRVYKQSMPIRVNPVFFWQPGPRHVRTEKSHLIVRYGSTQHPDPTNHDMDFVLLLYSLASNRDIHSF